MQHREVDELIITAPGQSGYIHRMQKRGIWAELNTKLQKEIHKGNYRIRWKNEQCHFVSELMIYGPMILNALVEKGYKKVLFVNHFNVSQQDWIIRGKIDRVHHTLPEGKTMIADPNVIFQFLPVIAKAYGYNITIDAVLPDSPSTNRHRFLIQDIYNHFGVSWTTSNKQYKLGGPRIELPKVNTDSNLYDCVVFAGVPAFHPDVEFTKQQIYYEWLKWSVRGYEIVDLWYNERSEKRFAASSHIDLQDVWSTILTIRKTWDEKPQDYSFAAEMLDDSMKVFKVE